MKKQRLLVILAAIAMAAPVGSARADYPYPGRLWEYDHDGTIGGTCWNTMCRPPIENCCSVSGSPPKPPVI